MPTFLMALALCLFRKKGRKEQEEIGMDEIELTILMPCLNEEKTIGGCIEEAQQYIANAGIKAEILIADNGSTDASVTIAGKLGAVVMKVADKGYGNALRGGIKVARGKYIIMGDCDASYDFLHLEEFIRLLRAGNELVMGNRFKGGIAAGAMPPSHQYFGVPLLSLAGRLRYHTRVGDFHCGIRGFDREAILRLGLHCEGMEFATELIGAAAQSGYRIAEIPVPLRCDGRNGKSHLHSVRDGLRHLKFIIFG